MSSLISRKIRKVHQTLSTHFGPLHWWPADTPFEVVVGAILTQNTAWSNVEKAIKNLKEADALAPKKIAILPVKTLEELIKPAGFFRQKALRLQDFAVYLRDQWRGSLTDLCSGPLHDARARLLSRPGIGPETADSILLYAVERPSFVVDAYTRRIFERLGILTGGEKYEEIRRIFMQSLAMDTKLYNEYHAQIVQLAKTCCRKNKPTCAVCPLEQECCHAKAAFELSRREIIRSGKDQK